MNARVKEVFVNSIYCFAGALVLIMDALYNGYPIIYHDISTYIANGFDLQTPIDRPITYCLFVRLFSLNGFSLWGVILAQAYLLSFILFELMRILFGRGIHKVIMLSVLALLSLLTGVSWTVSQVMPDIFTSIEVLIIAILLFGELSKKRLFLFYFLFLLATSMHLSHISFNIALLFILILIKRFDIFHLSVYLNYKVLLLLIGITIIGFTTMLSASAKSNHVFFMGAIAEHGILKDYLEEYCDENSYMLCKYKDSLPERAYQFVWDKDSPIYKMGGWKGSEKEFNKIIIATLTTPKYILKHIKASILATFDQLITFRINDSNGVFLEGSLPYDRILRYIPRELNAYRSSLQMNGQFGFTDYLNKVFTVIIIVSLCIIIALLLNKNIYRNKFLLVLALVILGVFLNAWVSGTFANSINRLGCKMIWLVPLLSILGLMQLYLQSKIKKSR